MSAESIVAPVIDLLGRLPLPGMDLPTHRMVLLAALLLAPACGTLGIQAVTFRLAFMSDAVAHSSYTGVALGLLAFGAGAAWGPMVGMVLVGLAVGLLVAALRENTRQASDTIINIVFSAAVAVGLTVVAMVSDRSLAAAIGPYLFGSSLGITAQDIVLLGLVLLAVTVFQYLAYNRLLFIGLNPVLARAHGLRTWAWGYAYAGLLALTVAVSIQITGMLLVGALIIAPAAAARNLARSAGGMFWWSVLLAAVTAVAGVELSIVLARPPTGATMILAAVTLYVGSEAVRALRRA